MENIRIQERKGDIVFYDIITNEIVVSAIGAGIVCHIWKFIDSSIRLKKLDWYSFIATGGMPSSHSTFVCALALSIGFVEGFLSATFLLATGLALIVVRDAFGVRHTVDKMNKSLNEIIKKGKFGVQAIWKMAGHTPVQAAVGCALGLIFATAVHFLFYF